MSSDGTFTQAGQGQGQPTGVPQGGAPVQQQQGQAQQGRQPQHQPMLPPIAPNPNLPQHQQAQQHAPAQQQQTQQPSWDDFYSEVGTQLGINPDQVRSHFAGDPRRIAGAVATAVRNRRNEQAQATPPVQQQQQQVPQPRADGLLPLPAGAEQFIRQTDQGWVPIDPMYKQYADIKNHNTLVEASRLRNIAQDPAALMKDQSFQTSIQDLVKAEAAKLFQEQNIVNVRNKYREQWGKEIFSMDNGQIGRDMEGNPIMTPFGIAFDAVCMRLGKQGMREGDEFYQTAYALAKTMVPATQQNNQQVQQQNYGQQDYRQYNAGVPGQGVQPQRNGIQQILDQSQQAQQYYPGTPPPRQNQVPSGLTYAGELRHHLQDAPEGMTMDYYLNLVHGK